MPNRELYDLLGDRLFDEPSDEGALNPWREVEEDLDRPDAIRLRRRNLRRYLGAVAGRPHLLLVGEAPGWRGCRFSGIPFTSEAQLERPDFPVTGVRTSLGGRPLSEISATIVWGSLLPLFPDFLLWNVFPFHPRPRGRPRANRRPRAGERRRFLPLLAEFVATAGAERVIAIGRTAEEALAGLGISCLYVRHPSQGGAPRFRKAIASLVEDRDLS